MVAPFRSPLWHFSCCFCVKAASLSPPPSPPDLLTRWVTCNVRRGGQTIGPTSSASSARLSCSRVCVLLKGILGWKRSWTGWAKWCLYTGTTLSMGASALETLHHYGVDLRSEEHQSFAMQLCFSISLSSWAAYHLGGKHGETLGVVISGSFLSFISSTSGIVPPAEEAQRLVK